MDELWALQQQLAALQNVSTQNKLSDRIIVDLISKLTDEYELKIIRTTDGQVMMTPTYLAQMIEQTIQQEGRVTLADLPDKLGVGIEKLQLIIEKESSKWKNIVKHQDELMSEDYIDQMCEMINETLQQRQELPLSELVFQYNLPMVFLKSQILVEGSDRMNIIEGVINGDKLTTTHYIDNIRSKLRGILRATIKPIALQDITKEYQFDDEISIQIIDQLIRDNQLEGKISQGQFIPERFLQNQESITRKFFTQNNFIEYDRLRGQLKVQKPKEYLKALFKDNFIPLEQCGFNRLALPSLKDQITELLANEGYTDLEVILPSALTENDLQTLLFKHMEIDDVELKNMLIFSNSYLYNLAEKLKPKMIESIYKSPQKLLEHQQQKQEDENIQASAGGFAKKKGKAVKGGKIEQKNKSDIFGEEEVFEFLVSNKFIERDDTSEELFQLLQPHILKLYEQVKIDLFENKKSASTELVQEIQRRIEEVSVALLISQRSIETVSQKYSQIDLRLLIDSCLYGYRLLIENIVVLICKKYSIQIAGNLFINENTLNIGLKQSINNQNSVFIDCGMQNITKIFKNKTALAQAIDCLPKDYQKILKEMLDFCIKKQLADVNKYYITNQDNIGIRAVLDKKSEKNYFQFIKYSNKEVFKSPTVETDFIFNKVVQVLLADKFSLYFVGNYDDKFNNVLQHLLYEAVTYLITSEQEPQQQQTKGKSDKSPDLVQIADPKLLQKQLQQIMTDLNEKNNNGREHVLELIKTNKL